MRTSLRILILLVTLGFTASLQGKPDIFGSWKKIVTAGLFSFGSARTQEAERDLYFSEAFFYAHQGRYFDALQRMDTELLQHYRLDEPSKDSLHPYLGRAEFSVGDFELNYRMHHRAGRAIRAVLEGDVAEPIRNEAAYRLARIHFQKGHVQAAQHSLDRIQGAVDDEVRRGADFLQANILLAIGRPADAAQILVGLQGAQSFRGFAAYNLGIALWRTGDHTRAYQQLTRAGTFKAEASVQQAIKDKANLVLGSLLMEEGEPSDAVPALQRVRLSGPFANQALLRAGWADAEAGRFERAVVPWQLLADRDPTQAAVQEAKLALPYAYGQLNVHGRAAVLYNNALTSFSGEVAKLEQSLDSIRGGHFLEALAREEVRHDPDWIVRLRELPAAPETYYLTELLASHEFHTGLRNYLDLENLSSRLRTKRRSFNAYQDLLDARFAYYDPILPAVDARFRALDSRIRLRRQQAQLLGKRMQDLLVMPRPEMLATAAEATASAKLHMLAQAIDATDDPASEALRIRLRRLNGVLVWHSHTEYHQRLTHLYEQLAELDTELAQMTEVYQNYVRVRQAASHSYQGYRQPFTLLADRVERALVRVDALKNRQGTVLEAVAIDVLQARRERLVEYQNTARFAMADSYDRATKALQAGGQ
jgi:hypothetical protein